MHVWPVKNAKPSEIAPALQPFQKSASAIQAVDATSTLVLRDNSINIKRMLEVLEQIDKPMSVDEQFKVIPVNFWNISPVMVISGPAGAARRNAARMRASNSRVPNGFTT